VLAKEPTRLWQLGEQPAGATEQARKFGSVTDRALVAPQQRCRCRTTIGTHRHQRWAMSIGSNRKNLN
jgi:hypothetical protein